MKAPFLWLPISLLIGRLILGAIGLSLIVELTLSVFVLVGVVIYLRTLYLVSAEK